MKIVRMKNYLINQCRACGLYFAFMETVFKVSDGCNPKYYHLQCKPKECCEECLKKVS